MSEIKLYHHGIKGQKWGVRRYQNKDGSLTIAGKKRQKDANKLATTASKYYDAINKYNALYDIGATTQGMNTLITKGKVDTERLIRKLDKRYINVSATPVFEDNGYVVKAVEASITKLDRLGRVSSINKSYTPVETYNNLRKEAEPRLKKEKAIIDKYTKKLSSTKDQDEIAKLNLELMEELDKIQ